MKPVIMLVLVALCGCSLVTVADRYGNRYGDWYNHGDQYHWQLATCEDQMNAQSVPPMERKLAMRCCMWHRGVPIDDSGSCGASG
jgi:hypothetical protein